MSLFTWSLQLVLWVSERIRSILRRMRFILSTNPLPRGRYGVVLECITLNNSSNRLNWRFSNSLSPTPPPPQYHVEVSPENQTVEWSVYRSYQRRLLLLNVLCGINIGVLGKMIYHDHELLITYQASFKMHKVNWQQLQWCCGHNRLDVGALLFQTTAASVDVMLYVPPHVWPVESLTS